MAEKEKIVVTGLGTVNALGNNIYDSWDKLINGESGVDIIKSYNVDDYPYASKVAGEVKNIYKDDGKLDFKKIYPEEFINKAQKLDIFVHFAQMALNQALEQSKIKTNEIDPERIGIVLGCGIGGMNIHNKQSRVFHTKQNHAVTPYYIPSFIGNMAAGFLSIVHNIKGPNLSVQTACASSNHALSMSKLILESDMADIIVSGGTEGIIEPLTISGFNSMKALSSSYNDAPKTASRPFDKGRDGFVIGEGSGILVLEKYSHAKKRNANILCELVGTGMSGDANHIVQPCVDGDGAFRAMRAAIKGAGITPEEIDYINCHGTSTPPGDIAEARAINKVMGGRKKGYNIGSTKSMTGHPIGAASAIEAIFSIMCLQKDIIVPNINIFNSDEKIEINSDIINLEIIEKKLEYVMSNSFGFGGHNSSIIFKKYRD